MIADTADTVDIKAMEERRADMAVEDGEGMEAAGATLMKTRALKTRCIVKCNFSSLN